jgi:hypothetical protein
MPHCHDLTCNSASDWKVPTTFIYGQHDWMNYQGAQQTRKDMEVPCEIIRVPQVSLPFWEYRIETNYKFSILDQGLWAWMVYILQGGNLSFIDNPSGFHSAVFYACRKLLSGDGKEGLTLPDGLISAWGAEVASWNNLILNSTPPFVIIWCWFTCKQFNWRQIFAEGVIYIKQSYMMMEIFVPIFTNLFFTSCDNTFWCTYIL